MENQKTRIGIIIPSSYFIKAAQNIVQQMEVDIELTVASAARLEAVPIGHQMEMDGVEVIVSRHGTRKNLNIPVLSVQLTSHSGSNENRNLKLWMMDKWLNNTHILNTS